MPRNLQDRAELQLPLFQAAAQQVSDALAAARQERDRRHDDPAAVDPSQWGTELGAAQHVEACLTELAELRAEEARVRADLAAISNPADAATHEAHLREVLVADAAMRVSLRHARERTSVTDGTATRLAALAEQADAGVRAAQERVTAATARQAAGDALRAALTVAPLDTIVVDAAALLGDAAFTAAADRVAALVPQEVRDRAAARATEAAAHLDRVRSQRETARQSLDTVLAAASPLSGEVAGARRRFQAAESELQRYVLSSAGQLAQASLDLTSLASLADLSTAQVDALDAANNGDGVSGLTAEQALADALVAVSAAEDGVADAILTALASAPDDDPETDAAVIAARAALADAAVQDPVTAARAGYDAAARDAVDAWEVELPAWLWDGLAAFVRTEQTLDELADQPARDALVTALDDAQDDWADALDAADLDLRRRWAVAAEAAQREAVAEAAEATTSDRTSQYTRGDGPSGRTPEEL